MNSQLRIGRWQDGSSFLPALVRMTVLGGLIPTIGLLATGACAGPRGTQPQGDVDPKPAPRIGTTPLGTPAQGYSSIGHHPTYGIAYANLNPSLSLPADQVWHGVAEPRTVMEVMVEPQVREWERCANEMFAWQQPEPRHPNWRHEFDAFESTYLIQRLEGQFVAQSISADSAGAPESTANWASIKLIPILRPNQAEADWIPLLNGEVWTPRTERISDIDLSLPDYVTKRPGFDFDSFIKNQAVIPFKNGYAVNLCGARIWDGRISQHRPHVGYRTSDGRELPGRLIRRVNSQIVEWVVAPNSVDLPKLPRVP